MKRLRSTVYLLWVPFFIAINLSAFYTCKPRTLAVGEVRVVFWAWLTWAPSEAEVQNAVAAVNAKAIFLRAGQFDLKNGEVERIRPALGDVPKTTEVHFVYNGTSKFLNEFEGTDTGKLAGTVAETYRADLERARKNNVEVGGLQLDLDVPTRLLPRYAELLRRVRELLRPESALSVTGLPTWADSDDIHEVLQAVDFWIPQCYGAKIPTRVDKHIPISSATEIERTIAKIRKLEKPFYAGLSAYGYAILYDENGDLVELRGNIDPDAVIHNSDLELIDKRSFGRGSEPSEVRYEYRAKKGVVVEGLIIRARETLVFDVPTSASLRASARAVRENAGSGLLGICLFRLPTAEDKTTLSLNEIAAALTDKQTTIGADISVERVSERQLRLTAKTTGTADMAYADDALTVDLDVPAGSVNGAAAFVGFKAYETLCRSSRIELPRPCSSRRANVLRLNAASSNPSAAITLNFITPVPENFHADITIRASDGRVHRESVDLQIQNRGE